MTDPLALFSLPQTESQARTTTVREHSRVVTPRSRRSDPSTSRNAAERVKPDASALAQAILARFTMLSYGLTDDELCRWLPKRHAPTVKSCRSRLSNAGLLVDSGEVRPSSRGVKMIVWRLGG